jgi:hypothetical protein
LTDKLERIDLSLRILKSASEVDLSKEELEGVRRIALAYLDAELGISPK